MSPTRPQTRQELYDRIRTSSKDEVIVEEMVRYGFWPKTSTVQDDPAEEIRRIGELERMVRSLATEASRLHDVEAMKKEARRRRMAQAKANREETKRRHEQARIARARAWAAKKKTAIQYLGDGVSGVLGGEDAAGLAAAMGIDVGELRWLAFHRKVSETTHYVRFQIPKKTGGTRLISAPMPRLKKVQTWILRTILDNAEIHDAAHGFVPGRSIVTNAAAHVGQQVVLNLDLKDFFPTLTMTRVFGLFRSMSYGPEAATILALLCTEPDVEELELDGRTWFVHASERHLPQGSPCSPAITNLICRRLDRRLAGLAGHLGFTYTRYADDLTFSSPAKDANVGRLLKAVRDIVVDEGFVVHPDKTRVMRRGRAQEVTGLVVNDRLGVPRRLLRQWRATLFQIRRDGPDGKRFGLGTDVMASLTGFAAFVRMVDPPRGDRMLAEVRQIADALGYQLPKRKKYAVKPKKAPEAPPPEAAAEAHAAPTPEPPDDGGGKPRAKWYEFWKWLG